MKIVFLLQKMFTKNIAKVYGNKLKSFTIQLPKPTTLKYLIQSFSTNIYIYIFRLCRDQCINSLLYHTNLLFYLI